MGMIIQDQRKINLYENGVDLFIFSILVVVAFRNAQDFHFNIAFDQIFFVCCCRLHCQF